MPFIIYLTGYTGYQAKALLRGTLCEVPSIGSRRPIVVVNLLRQIPLVRLILPPPAQSPRMTVRSVDVVAFGLSEPFYNRRV
jgi:hypothetical protein